MTFWRRFRLFLLGVGLGLILVWIFFGNRELNTWTPQSRVLRAIDSSEVTISQRAACQLNCLNINDAQLDSIKSKASVNFSESNVDAEPCPVYRLESEFRERDYQLIWKVCERDEKVELLSLLKIGQSCNCE